MRHGHRRRKAAAALYVGFGLLVLLLAVVTGSIVLLALAGLSLLMAPVALYRYPTDRNW
jgi:hypothetical protein